MLAEAGEGPGMAIATIIADQKLENQKILGDAAATRERFIPVRKTDLVNTLIAHGRLASEREREEFRRLCDLLATFGSVMQKADFIEVSLAEIERAHREHPVLRVEVETSTREFREVRFF